MSRLLKTFALVVLGAYLMTSVDNVILFTISSTLFIICYLYLILCIVDLLFVQSRNPDKFVADPEKRERIKLGLQAPDEDEGLSQ